MGSVSTLPRGGRRAGTSGTGYTNRTDLNANRGLTPAAAPGQQYGKETQQINSQKVVPIAPPPAPGLSQPAATGSSPAAPAGAPPTPAPAGASTPPQPAPGGSLFTPPPQGHPVTSGLPFGPGPGPESLPSAMANQMPAPSPLIGALSTLNALGKGVSPVVNAVRAQVNATNAAGMHQ